MRFENDDMLARTYVVKKSKKIKPISSYFINLLVRKYKKCFLFRFPLKNPSLLKSWLIEVKRDKWKPSQYSVLCEKHVKL